MIYALERCLHCDSQRVKRIGAVPASTWFAGKRLKNRVTSTHLYRCRDCRMSYKHPVLAQEEYERLYDNELPSNWSDAGPRRDWAAILDYLDGRLQRSGNVLDFGCNDGSFLMRLPGEMVRYGIEINSAAAAKAAKENGVRVYRTLDAIPADLRFSLITVVDVIEHVPDPKTFLLELSARLDTDGLLVLSTGDAENRLWRLFGANWWYCFNSEHISFISVPWLARFCRDHELRIGHIRRFRYYEIRLLQYPIEAVFTVLFGVLPTAYLALRRKYDERKGLDRPLAPPGGGLSRDHIMVVLLHDRGTARGREMAP